mgnify:CR=1 FL=1
MSSLEKKFYTFEAVEVNGTMKQVTEKLNEINNDKTRQFVFMSNIVKYPNGEVGCIIQTKKFR